MKRIGVLVISCALLMALGATALARGAADPSEKNYSGGRGQAGEWLGKKFAEARQHVMRTHREAFVDGKVVTVDTDRGELTVVQDDSVEIKYEDSTTTRIDFVGKVTVCSNGKPGGNLSELSVGESVLVIRAKNTPRGDHTLVMAHGEKLWPCVKIIAND